MQNPDHVVPLKSIYLDNVYRTPLGVGDVYEP